MTGLHYDPVADGKPSPSRLAYGLMAVVFAFGVFKLSQFQLWPAFRDLLLAAAFYLVERYRQVYWLLGYQSAIESTSEQLEAEVDPDA